MKKIILFKFILMPNLIFAQSIKPDNNSKPFIYEYYDKQEKVYRIRAFMSLDSLNFMHWTEGGDSMLVTYNTNSPDYDGPLQANIKEHFNNYDSIFINRYGTVNGISNQPLYRYFVYQKRFETDFNIFKYEFNSDSLYINTGDKKYYICNKRGDTAIINFSFFTDKGPYKTRPEGYNHKCLAFMLKSDTQVIIKNKKIDCILYALVLNEDNIFSESYKIKRIEYYFISKEKLIPVLISHGFIKDKTISSQKTDDFILVDL